MSDAQHWADFTADRIIKQLGDKNQYTLASGITPSGVVHFGNFREVITTEFVARALRNKGKNVRFIFSWDDYDTFRKVPANMPEQEMLTKHMYQPIVDTPDPFGVTASYAAHHEKNFEAQLEKMGIKLEPIYQAQKYRSGAYKNEIIKTLKERQKIVDILNKHRSEPLPDSWLPVSIYCANCNRDEMAYIKFDGDHQLSYKCQLCHHEGSEDLLTTSRAKLPWRMDWPMRWAYESVDFEPGGKDHSSQGGSYTTAKEIVSAVYAGKVPVYLQYDFVSVKGKGGKMSSSKGNLVTVNDVLDIYEPEMVRWIFASYKSNVDFGISFDLDVIKTYEDFDRNERIVYGKEPNSEKKQAMAKRVYELSSLDGQIPNEMPFQPSFRHLTNILQIFEGDIARARSHYQHEIKNERDERRFQERAKRANFWLAHYAPEEFKFSVNKSAVNPDLSSAQKNFLQSFKQTLQNEWGQYKSENDLHESMYKVIHESGLEPAQAFTAVYQVLISKEKGPKLANFLMTIGQQKVLGLL